MGNPEKYMKTAWLTFPAVSANKHYLQLLLAKKIAPIGFLHKTPTESA